MADSGGHDDETSPGPRDHRRSCEKAGGSLELVPRLAEGGGQLAVGGSDPGVETKQELHNTRARFKPLTALRDPRFRALASRAQTKCPQSRFTAVVLLRPPGRLFPCSFT